MERSISLKELKLLFSAPNMPQATSRAFGRIKARRWHLGGEAYSPMGIDWNRDKVSFMRARNVGVGVCSVSIRSLSIADALDCASGNLLTAHVG